MAKGIYVGTSTKIVQGNMIPKAWTEVVAGTKYTADDGTILTASGVENTKYGANKACDFDMTTYWYQTGQDAWLKLEFTSAKKIYKMQTKIIDELGEYITYAKIQGSNNDSTWIDLYTTSSNQSNLTEIELKDVDYYKYYRMLIHRDKNYGNSVKVYEWQTSEYEVVDESQGTARKVKKAYVGVDNKARKIKKGYIGVGGIARLFFSSDKIISFYGPVSDLSTARTDLAATTVGDYALFGGGGGSTKYSTVDTYTSTLAKGTATDLSVARYYLAATSIGNYALFGGGNGNATTVDTYTSSLSKSTATNLSTGRPYLKATTVGNYALFGGGGADYKSSTSTVDAYTSTLSKSTATSLTSAANYLAATSIGNYALFAGGRTGSADSTSLTTVNTYTSSLARGTATSLTTARYNLAATTAGDYALFAGGHNGSTLSIVDTYNSSLVKGTTTNLSVVGQYVAATTLGGFAIFAGGHNNDVGNATNAINIYSDNLTHTVSEGTLSNWKYNVAATSIGNYAIFAGGEYGSRYASADALQLVG